MLAREIQVQRQKMREVARAMRTELEALENNSHQYEGGPRARTMGTWDAAQEMGAGVDASHQSMITAYKRFILAYEEVIGRIDEAAARYDRNEQDVVGSIDQRLLEWTERW